MAQADAWRPGQSGNPLGGRLEVLRLVKFVRSQTRDGRELVAFMVDVMRGNPLPVEATRKGRRRYPQRPKIEHRMAAAAWLADRGWGKPKESIEVTGESSASDRLAMLRRLSDEDRAQLRALLARALAPPPTPAGASAIDAPELQAGAGAPELLGQPRNVGRQAAPELELVEPELVELAPDPEPSPPPSPPPPA